MFGKRTDATDGKNKELPEKKLPEPQAEEHPASLSDGDFPDITDGQSPRFCTKIE